MRAHNMIRDTNRFKNNEQFKPTDVLIEWIQEVCDELGEIRVKLDKLLIQTTPKTRAVRGTSTKIDVLKMDLPKSLDTHRMRRALVAWYQHRVEKKNRLTERSLKAQINKMVEWGEDRSIQAIKHTIFKGWLGLREPFYGEEQNNGGGNSNKI